MHSGYGHMTWFGMWWWWILLLVLVIFVVWVITAASRRSGGAAGLGVSDDAPETIVKRRYAAGEIDRETYERMLADLKE
jgi:putative membrane protein